MDKVLFLDLDHTIIQPKEGRRFPKSFDDWEFIESTKSKILEFYEKGYKIVIVSNQSGVSTGITTEEELEVKFETIKAILNIPILFFYAKTKDDDDPMRKPNTGMAEKAAEIYDIDWENSIMVGDASDKNVHFSDSDRKFAENAGIGHYYHVTDFANV